MIVPDKYMSRHWPNGSMTWPKQSRQEEHDRLTALPLGPDLGGGDIRSTLAGADDAAMKLAG
jgi:hypothetical protein